MLAVGKGAYPEFSASKVCKSQHSQYEKGGLCSHGHDLKFVGMDSAGGSCNRLPDRVVASDEVESGDTTKPKPRDQAKA